MKKISHVFICLLCCFSAYAQKQYIWEPKPYTPASYPNIMTRDTLYLSISDNRGMPSNSKVNFTSQQLKQTILELFKHTYPGAELIYDENFYFSEYKDGYNIKVGITKYCSTFSPGVWTGWTTFDVNFCKRVNGVNLDNSKSVAYYSSAGNALGYSSGKKCLNNAYRSSVDEMFNFINSSYANIENQLKTIQQISVNTNSQSSLSIKEDGKEVFVDAGILSTIKTSASQQIISPKDIYKKCSNAVFMIYTTDGAQTAQGSGFFISNNGIAVSNYHVFKGTYKGLETIKLTNGQTYKIKEVLGYSEKLDFIVFQVDGESFDYIPVNINEREIGEEVYAIGSPRGLENTMSNGLISQKHKDFIYQISVPIDHGSSGGALINQHGEVVGITCGGIDSSGANLNFAIDIKAIFSNKF